MYRVERYEAEIPVREYLDACVNVEEFLEYCKACHNYGRLWSCPPYDFKPEAYWAEFDRLYILGFKIILDEKMKKEGYSPEELKELTGEILEKEKRAMAEELFKMEKELPGSKSLSAGCCTECQKGTCTREEGKPCRNPEKLRYSLESLGANVGLTIRKYLKQELLWMEEGRLPEYFILVGGLLMPRKTQADEFI